METTSARILEAKRNVEINGGDLTDLLVEWSNDPTCEINEAGDVSSRGEFWTDEHCEAFLGWLASR